VNADVQNGSLVRDRPLHGHWNLLRVCRYLQGYAGFDIVVVSQGNQRMKTHRPDLVLLETQSRSRAEWRCPPGPVEIDRPRSPLIAVNDARYAGNLPQVPGQKIETLLGMHGVPVQTDTR